MFTDPRHVKAALVVVGAALVLVIIVLAGLAVRRSLRNARRTLDQILIEEADRTRAQAEERNSVAQPEELR